MTMKTFKIILRLDNLNYESPVLEIECKNWNDVCNEISEKIEILEIIEKIEIIDTEEK